jgi:transcriptional regulator with XRE-family HTH domain
MTDEKQQLRLLGHAIRSEREKHGLTVPELAVAAGISSERLQGLENGELDPDFELLLRLGKCLDTPTSAFFILAEELGKRRD